MRNKDRKRKERAQQADQADAVRRIWDIAKRTVGPMPLAQRETAVHTILYSALLNHENNMRKAGIKIPDDYVEDRIEAKCRKGSAIEPLYTMCKRCEFSKPYKLDDGSMVHRCTEFYSGPRREVYVVSDDDGCSRGLPRKEYR